MFHYVYNPDTDTLNKFKDEQSASAYSSSLGNYNLRIYGIIFKLNTSFHEYKSSEEIEREIQEAHDEGYNDCLDDHDWED